MAAKKIDYWGKRRELEDKARLKMENEMLKNLTSIYPEALKNIQEKLLSQADLHNITISDLLSDYSKRNQEKYREYIEKNYQELIDSDEKYNEFISEFFPAYDYAKVNRLLQIRSDIFKELAQQTIGNDANKLFADGLEQIFNNCYTSNSNVFAQLGLSGPYGASRKELEAYLNYPWSGKTFSNRLWGNISRLEQNLSQSIVNAVASGEGVEDALKRMRNNSVISDMFKLEADKFSRALENLVRTEYAHFSVAGLNKSLDDAGLKNKVAWSAEDERVCSVCGERHNKIIKDGWFPPYHGRCRCTVMPKMDDLGEDIDKLYDEMFGNLLDEFAKDKFGINLK
ncbi:phage minor head protein [uncultured Enterococcus sp.]|uniref:phage minor head protein n=1 Tax=uncultured Enterococcus sp. TaxID=167972 RepID=UPI002AA6C604|nr:phage minor head protein [uncultured Enterococcus sp.]